MGSVAFIRLAYHQCGHSIQNFIYESLQRGVDRVFSCRFCDLYAEIGMTTTSTLLKCATCCSFSYASLNNFPVGLRPLVARRPLPSSYSDGYYDASETKTCIIDFYPDDIDTCMWNIILDTSNTSAAVIYVVFCTPLDMLANLSVSPAMLSKDITVQSGFHAVVSNTYRNLMAHLTKVIHEYHPERIIATGHSLGGCLAQLFALRYHKEATTDSPPISVITFGAPMAAYSTIASLDVPASNYILPNDPIPRLPYVFNNPRSRAVRSLQGTSNLPFLSHYARSLNTLLSGTTYLPRCIPLGVTLLINGDHTLNKSSEQMRSHVASIDTVVNWEQHEVLSYVDAVIAMDNRDLPINLLQWIEENRDAIQEAERSYYAVANEDTPSTSLVKQVWTLATGALGWLSGR